MINQFRSHCFIERFYIKWTKEKDKYLKENLNEMTSREMAEQLGTTKHAVSGRLHTMGLHRTAAAREKMKKRTRFKKGHKSWNKDKRGMHFSPATEFKKGHIPVNVKYDGCIRTRYNYKRGTFAKWIRISQNKWVAYNRYVWEKHHGEIPTGLLVVHKDGNPLNCDIDNLYLITRAENAIRNQDYESDNYIASTIARSDKELRKELLKHPKLLELKRTQLKLRRAINESKG